MCTAPNYILMVSHFCHAVSLSCLPTSILQELTVPHHLFYPLCCREHFFTWHVEEMWKLSSIFWRKGQTLLLKTTMVKPPSHGQFVQDTSKINILVQYTKSIRFGSLIGEPRTNKLNQGPKNPKSWWLCCLAAVTEMQLSTSNIWQCIKPTYWVCCRYQNVSN